ncbi:hypothetical protein AB0F77_38910 [Streptomyces sp. NPDC026672]|uniref:hypothetical protein n=1 Tax=unclassified Streptomyces TaxID=2593676 RepID=UPI0033C05A6B
MVAEHPAGNGGLGGEDGGTPVPDAVWRRFLDDNEQAIRASAAREPSAQERAEGVRPGPTNGTDVWHGTAEHGPAPSRMGDVVGDLWDPEAPWTASGWRDLNGPGKRRRAGRVLAAVAAVIVAVGALDRVATRPVLPDGTPDEGTAQQAGDILPDGVPTALAPGPLQSGTPSSTIRTKWDGTARR